MIPQEYLSNNVLAVLKNYAEKHTMKEMYTITQVTHLALYWEGLQLIQLKLRHWAGLAGLLCFVQGAGVAPEPSEHEENQEQGSSLLYLHDPDMYW